MLYLPVYVGLGPILNKLRSKLLPIDIQKDKYGLYSSPKKALSLFDMPIYTSIKLVVAVQRRQQLQRWQLY